jgi:putative transposase
MCQLVDARRAGCHRYLQRLVPAGSKDQALRDEIRKVASQWPAYGSRRIREEFWHRGWDVSRKRAQRIMREINLPCLRERQFVVTTNSGRSLPVYPNLARDMVLTDIDQLWVADNTYIRLVEGFVYLAVVLDICSRRMISWELDRTLEARLVSAGLELALRRRTPLPRLAHHSDRGLQCAPNEYTGRLTANEITTGMSRNSDPWDDTARESFIKTLKHQEGYLTEYRDLFDARAPICEFLGQVYNRMRLQSALGYLSPGAVESARRRLRLPQSRRGRQDSSSELCLGWLHSRKACLRSAN